MSPPLPMIGAGELVSAAGKALRDWDALMVVEEGKPVGVITRYDLLGFLSEDPGAVRAPVVLVAARDHRRAPRVSLGRDAPRVLFRPSSAGPEWKGCP